MHSSANPHQPHRRAPSLASRIAAAKRVAEQYRDLARIAGQGTAHHGRMLTLARTWDGRAAKLARKQTAGMPETFTLSPS